MSAPVSRSTSSYSSASFRPSSGVTKLVNSVFACLPRLLRSTRNKILLDTGMLDADERYELLTARERLTRAGCHLDQRPRRDHA